MALKLKGGSDSEKRSGIKRPLSRDGDLSGEEKAPDSDESNRADDKEQNSKARDDSDIIVEGENLPSEINESGSTSCRWHAPMGGHM